MPNYRIDTFKAWGSRDIERAWSNSYEFVSSQTSPSALIGLGNQLIVAEKKMHLPNVEFLQFRIATHAIEPSPFYDPSAFTTIPVEGIGSRAVTGTDPLDYNVCFVVQRVPASGRAGRLFMRGCLVELDVNSNADGMFRLQTTSTLATGGTVFEGFKTDLAGFISVSGAPVADPGLAMVGTYGSTTIARYVTALRNGGVSINKRNHRYFDRGPVG
jgi:hypothetical protein